jgi:hypothetical protein
MTPAVLDGGIKVKLQLKLRTWEGTFSAPFDERTDHPVYKAYERANIEYHPVWASKISACTIPCGVTFNTPIGVIRFTENNVIDDLDIRRGDNLDIDIERGDGSPPEVIAAQTIAAEKIAAEMIKNIYLATFAPEHLRASWRAE